MINYKEIAPTDTYSLRQSILRPHQSLEEMVYEFDDHPKSLHMGAFIDQSLEGIISLYPQNRDLDLSNQEWRVRGMATSQNLRGQGAGKKLLNFAVTYAQRQGAVLVWCVARASAEGFYRKYNFTPTGSEFEVEGFGPHWIYVKTFAL